MVCLMIQQVLLIFFSENETMPNLVYNALQAIIASGAVLFILYKDGPMLGRKIKMPHEITN